MTINEARGVAARIWCDPDYGFVMNTELCENIAQMLWHNARGEKNQQGRHEHFCTSSKQGRYEHFYAGLKRSLLNSQSNSTIWLYSVSGAAQEEGVDSDTARKIATRWMQQAFDVTFEEEVRCDHEVINGN
jgi:hypothetical protein